MQRGLSAEVGREDEGVVMEPRQGREIGRRVPGRVGQGLRRVRESKGKGQGHKEKDQIRDLEGGEKDRQQNLKNVNVSLENHLLETVAAADLGRDLEND